MQSSNTKSSIPAPLIVGAVALGLLVCSCCFCGMLSFLIPSDSPTVTDAGEEQQPTDPVPADQPAGFDDRVTPATASQLDRIAAGLEQGFALQRDAAWTVRSTSHADAHYVVAFIDGPGVTNSLAAWGHSGSPDASEGLLFSANNIATEFSSWPSGYDTTAGIWFTDDDCSKLLAYARARK